jgi:prophage regulatory protein
MSQAMPNNFDALPDAAFVRANSLFAAGLLPFSRATLWRLVKAGKFPAPAKISENVTAWEVGAVRRWKVAVLEGDGSTSSSLKGRDH